MMKALSRFGLVVVLTFTGCTTAGSSSAPRQSAASIDRPIMFASADALTPTTQPAEEASLAPTAITPQPVTAPKPVIAPSPIDLPDHSISANPLPADAQRLDNQAIVAMATGDFTRSRDLLSQAEDISHDGRVARMLVWIDEYEKQITEVAKQRHAEFEQTVSNAHKLLDHHLDTYAVEEARVAYLLADDKNTFRQQPWVDNLVKQSAVAASKAEDAQQWVTALRLYTALIGLEPANPAWKVKHKAVFRRARILSDYAPDRYEQLLAAEQKESDVAATIIKPTTQPTAASIAATQPDDSLAVEDNFRLNWHDLTRGIELDTLGNALRLAEKQYYRNIDYQTLLEGGLIGIKAVATTDGLDDTFTGLRDKENRAKFIDAIDACVADAHAATPDTAEDVCFDSMQKLIDLNHKTVQLPDEVFVREFADGAFAQLDPFSTMTWPFDMDELEKTTQGEFGGVGIRIEVDGLQKTLKVVTPVANTPARKAGIKPGGIITRINGKSARGITVEQAVKTITGVPGSTVTLTIRDLSGVEKDYILRREVIKNPSVEGFLPKWNGEWNWFVDPDQKIATIRLNQFSKNTAEDLGKALDQIKSDGARGVILDLRANPGGLLQSATEIVNKFIADGVIVSTHADRPTGNPPTEADAQPQGVQSALPMVVLINQYSASASEIVSGALQDHKRAILIGERSFGKGSVQMLFQLDQDKETCLRLTTSHYYLPSGRCIHREENSQSWGVDPDVTVDLTPEQMSKVNQTREDMDVLPEPGMPTTAPDTEGARAKLLSSDPQLAAAVLVLRLELQQGKL